MKKMLLIMILLSSLSLLADGGGVLFAENEYPEPILADIPPNPAPLPPFYPLAPNPPTEINGSIQTFNDLLTIPLNVDGSSTVDIEYKVYSLTNYEHEDGAVRDITTSLKQQYRHDCTKFATAAAIETETMRQYFSIFNNSINTAVATVSPADAREAELRVGLNLSEAYAREVVGCEENSNITISETLAKGLVQEEHYPYYERRFMETAYYSMRDTDRYGYSNLFYCDVNSATNVITGGSVPHYNQFLFQESLNNGMLTFLPVNAFTLDTGDADTTVALMKEYLKKGHPIMLNYKAYGVEQLGTSLWVNQSDSEPRWGRNEGLRFFRTVANAPNSGHAVLIVGYMEPDDPNPAVNNQAGVKEFFIIKNSTGRKSFNVFPIRKKVDDGAGNLVWDNVFYNRLLNQADVFDKIDIRINNFNQTEADLANYDTDQDGIPDLFDNCSFSGVYANDATISNNPDQIIDEDNYIYDVDLCPYHRDKTTMNMDHDSIGDMCDPDIDGDGISNIDEGMSAAYLHQIIPANNLAQSDYAALNPFVDGSVDKIRGKYFITSCFAGLATHCDETDPGYCTNGNKPGNKYITDLCFFDDNRIDSTLTIARNGTFKFAGGGSYDESDLHNGGILDSHFPPPNYWYLKKYTKGEDDIDPDFLFHHFPNIFTFNFPYLPEGLKRTYEYTDSSGVLKTGVGAKWNIPGQFEMSNVTYQEYAVNSSYGENWPENYYNCYVHCYLMSNTNSGFSMPAPIYWAGYYEHDLCEESCDYAYGANEPNDPNDDTCNTVLDYDCDGIRDLEDNCPYTWNIDQKDEDEIDSVTGEWIGDGVGNACDNCVRVLNPREMNNLELVSAPCNVDGTVGGAACLTATRETTKRDAKGNYYWQPDHDLDGSGDVCDNDFIAWLKFRNAPKNQDSPPVKVSETTLSTTYEIRHNVSTEINLDLVATSYVPEEEYNATNRFCGLNPEQYAVNLWGQAGYCSTERKNNSSCIIDFGYSHGSDLKPIAPSPNVEEDYIENWKPATFDNHYEKIEIENRYHANNFKWSWRTDFVNLFPIYEQQLTNPPLCSTYDDELNECFDTGVFKFYYSLSSGLLNDNSPQQYIASNFDTNTGNENVNGLYFRNQDRYMRSERLSKDPISISYFKREKIVLKPSDAIIHCLGAPCNFPERWWHDFFLDELINGPRPYETPGMEHYFKNEFGSDMTRSSIELREWSNPSNAPTMASYLKPQFLATVTRTDDDFKTGIEMTSQNIMQFMAYTPQSSNIVFQLVEMDKGSNGDWRKRGTLINVPDYFLPVSSTYYNGKLYVLSIEETSSANLKKIYEVHPVDTLGNVCGDSLNTFEPVFIEDVSFLSGITMHSFSDYIAVIGDGGNGMEVHKLAKQNGDFYLTDISGQTLPQSRDVYTVERKNNELFLAGGAEVGSGDIDLKTDAWKFSESNGWTLIRNDLNIFPGSFRIDFEGDNLVLTDRYVSPSGKTERISFKEDGTGSLSVETVDVDGAPVTEAEDYYCLYNDGTFILGGIELNGTCEPFPVPQYDTVSVGATVYTLTGQGTELAVGTGSDVKIYELSDPLNPVLNHTQTVYGPASDMLVYDNKLIIAVDNGIDTIDLVTYAYTHTATYGTTKALEVYNGKLYVGDGQGIKTFDPDTLTLISQINTSGDVAQLEIIDGTVYTFEWAGLKRYDADTLAEIQTDSYYVSNPETFVYNGTLYIYKNNATVELTFNGSAVTETSYVGDVVELRNHFTYGNYTYFPEGSNLRISTIDDDPAPICGNSHLETGEVCDGGSVACTTLSGDYIGGTATCNSTCDGYNEDNCEIDDGW